MTRWSVSDPFPESALPEPELGGALAGRSWTDLEAEPSGLLDLARAHGIVGDRNTVFARTTIHADRFLGSIGWYDTLYLPFAAGGNELVVAVAEDFGGWRVQARLSDGR